MIGFLFLVPFAFLLPFIIKKLNAGDYIDLDDEESDVGALPKDLHAPALSGWKLKV